MIQAATPAPAARSSRSPASWIGWAILGLSLTLGFGGACMTCSRAMNLDQEESFGDGRHKIGVVELTGPITDGTELVRQIRRFAKRDDLAAILIRIDSPGGAVAPSQEIFAALRAAAINKPVVASMGTVAASGGFWVAMGADYVFASPGSITGSIGVITQTPDLRKLAGLIGLDLKTYRTGPNKDLGNPFREVTVAEEAVLMDLMNDLYEQFVETVAERRKLDVSQVRPIADGRVLSGRKAQQAGLIDALGGLHEAAKKAAELAEARQADKDHREAEPVEEDPTLVYPKKPGPGLLRLLAEEGGQGMMDGVVRSWSRVTATEPSPVPSVEAR